MRDKAIHEAPVWTDVKTFDGKPWRGKVDIVAAGYPCFARGTMVLTYDGYKPIEMVRVGDRVLTHRGRWRRVSATMRKHGAPVWRVKAQGVPGVVCTRDHPFWARERYFRTDGARKRVFEKPEWVNASDLGDRFVGQVLPPVVVNEESPELWWLVGRYLADGWRQCSPSQHGKGRVNICCHFKEASSLEKRIKAAGYSPYKSRERTAIKFAITRREFYEFLRPFGHLASGKTIPGWVLGLDQSRASALLDGYLSGDGYNKSNGRRSSSVSKSLSLGLALLAQRVSGTVAGVRFQKQPRKCIIEGRTVNQKSYWVVDFYDHNRSAFVDGQYGWKLVRSVRPCGRATVWNIAVEGDESYVADGAIVHNCQPFSCIGQQKGVSDPRHLWPFIAGIARDCQPAAIFIENVSNHLNIGFELVREEILGLGFRVEAGIFSASEMGAPHARKRLFVLGYAKGRPVNFPSCQQGWEVQAGGRGCGMDGEGSVGPSRQVKVGSSPVFPPPPKNWKRWKEVIENNRQDKPAFLDVDDELASGLGQPDIATRESQTRILGNGVVPVVAAYAFSILRRGLELDGEFAPGHTG